MKQFSLISIVIFVFTFVQSASAAKNAYFYSDKTWDASRWYIIGEISDSAIRWWGEGSQKQTPLNSTCKLSKGFNHKREESGTSRELLQSGRLILIEVDPLSTEEIIELSAKNNIKCKVDLKIEYAFGDKNAPLKPYIFIDSVKTRYRGINFVFYVPPSSGSTEVQFDMLMGYWNVTTNQSAAGANSNLHLVPAAIARVEWKPTFFNSRVGLTMELEQNISVIGNSTGQNLNFSDVIAGGFYEHYIPVKDGWFLRYSGKLYQHFADDGPTVSTLDSSTEFMFLPTIAVSSKLYFANRYFWTVGIEYGIPNDISTSGVTQSMYAFTNRLGLRLTSSILWMFELNGRQFLTDTNSAQDTVLQFNSGVRLEL